MSIKELGTSDAYVRRMTNALFLIPRGRQGKEYADIETDPPKKASSRWSARSQASTYPWAVVC